MSRNDKLIKKDASGPQDSPLQSAEDQKVFGLLKNGYGYQDSGESDEINLLDYWAMVRKHLWIVIGVALLLTTVVALFMARQPDVYEARARVQVDWESANPAGGAVKGSAVILNNSASDPTYFNTQLQILTSPPLLGRAVRTLNAEDDVDLLFKKAQHSQSTWDTLLRMVRIRKAEVGGTNGPGVKPSLRPRAVAPASQSEDLAEAERLDNFVMAIQSGLEIEPVQEVRLPVKETRLIDIAYSHTDPRFAAKVANVIADTYVLSNHELRTSTGVSSGDFLQKRIAELQSQVREGEEALVAYATNHEILSLEGNQNTVVERLAGLNRQVLEAENDRKIAEAAYLAALSPGAAEALAEGTARSAGESELKMNDLRRQREQLLVEHTEKWPEIKEIDRQITELERQISESRRRASNTVLTNLETKYHQSVSREQSLSTAFAQQRSETITQNEAAINYRIKQQEIATNKELLDGLLQRAKENDVLLAGTANNIRVTNYALIPRKSVAPHRLRIVGVAFAIALAFGIGLAVLLEYADVTLRSPEDVEKYLRLTALLAVPAINRSTMRFTTSPDAELGNLQLGAGKRDNPELLLNTPANSALSEAYRRLRTSVLLSTAGHPPRTLLITSALQGEGKTTVATNIAISLAQTGAKVLLIDADMRRPRIHEHFSVPNTGGLSTCLSSDMNGSDFLRLIHETPANCLHLLTSGPVPPNPAELLGSDQMRKMLKQLESTFAHIVIDSPPAAIVTDAVLLGSMVEGVLLVVRHCSTSREVARRVRQVLQDVGAKVFGVVLNRVKLKAQADYYDAYNQPYKKTPEGDVASAA
jgi:succinoglycan biosynthesis transport protein ExoP